jgi:multiple RNA-binding domain-containing protein 1
MAVVEFERPDEAAKGFRAVAYRRLGNSIIYLEKGPLGMFDENFSPADKDDQTSSKPQTISSAIRVPEHSIADISKPVDDDQDLPIRRGTTLYLKNLAFSTTQDRLVKVFSHLPSFSFARVQTKADPKRPGGRLSMGYGFIGFKDTEAAEKALKSIHGFVFDGHALHVSFAGRGADEPDSKSADPTSTKSRTTKMIVKNVPFEATKKDIRDLFGYVAVFSIGLLIIDLFTLLVPMANSNPFVFPRSSTLDPVVLYFFSLSPAMKQRMHTQRYAILICSVDIWF